MARRPAASIRRDEGGFALLVVVWVTAILAVVAAGFLAASQSETRVAGNLLAAARARALAEAGVARATAGLLDPDLRRQWRADGRPYRLRLDGGTLVVRIVDEGGKIDLNRAPLALIANLADEMGLVPATTASLMAFIAQRRRAAAVDRPEHGPTPYGVPAMADRQAAAFSSVEELRLLPALDRESYSRLRPFLTVFSERDRIDPTVAPREVLLSLPGVDPTAVAKLLEARAASKNAAEPLPSLPGVARYVARAPLRAATVTAAARTADGAAFARHAVIGFTGDPRDPVRTLEWRRPIDGESQGTVAASKNDP